MQAVIFDIGGVLEWTPGTAWRTRWAARLGLPEAELRSRMGAAYVGGDVGAITEAEFEDRVRGAFDLEDGDLAALLDDMWDEYLGTPNTELIEVFAGLRARARVGILSNSFVGAREREQARYGFADMCEAVVYSHEIGVNKPDPEAFRAACRSLGVAPAQALLVDDVQENVDAARVLGMAAHRFVENGPALEAIEAFLSDP